MGDSTQADTKTTTQILTPEQQRLTQAAAGQYDKFAASNPTLPTGDQAVAPFNPNQIGGQQSVLDSAGGVGGDVNTAANMNRNIAGGAFLDPGSDPYVQNAVKAATNPIYDHLNRKTLPGIDAGASTGAGGVSANFGGSRQGVLEANATKDANDTAGNVGAGILNTARQEGIGATGRAIAQTPTSATSRTLPGVVQSTVGDTQQQQAQNVLDANNQAGQLQQWLPAIKAMLLTQGASGLPGSTTTSTGTGNQSPSGLQTAVGLGTTAAGLMGSAAKLLPLLAL